MSTISNTGFWSGESVQIHHVHCVPLANWIIDYLKMEKNKPIYDFGCGLGNYLLSLHVAGFKNLTGFEGDVPFKKVFNNIKQQDLTKQFTVPEKGNCIFLEVAEHVPVQFENQLLKNVLSSCNGKLIMSWAIRNQPGYGHINCYNNDEVIEKISSYGFNYLDKDSSNARSVIVDTAHWFKSTIMIFDCDQQTRIR
ncbi:MAG: hypothetical protein ACOYO1_05065 [Bacteroidales bacterium]